MKFCKECKHFDSSDRCTRANFLETSFVSGISFMRGFRDPFTERRQGWLLARLFNRCGKDARFWEYKE